MANNQFSNNAASNLAAGITNSATSLTVTTGQGALFPTLTGSQYFYATLANASGTLIEIVKVTARATDTFTIVRAQDGTAALPWSLGDKVELRLTRAVLNNLGQLDSANTWAGQNIFTDATSTFAGNAATSTMSNDTNNLAGVPAANYALLASPAFSGNPTAPTPAFGDNDTSIATTAFVQANSTGETLLGSASAPFGGGTTISIPIGVATGYKYLKVVINGLVHSLGTAQAITIGQRQMSTTFTGGATLGLYGQAFLYPNQVFVSTFVPVTPSGGIVAGTSTAAVYAGQHAHSFALSNLVIGTVAGTASFTSGSIQVYGGK